MHLGNLTRQEAQERSRLISGARYRIHLDLTGGDETYGCVATIAFTCSRPGSETFLEYAAPSVESIELNGAPVSTGAFDGARIKLEGVAEQNEVRIRSSSAYGNTGSGMHRFVDPSDGAVYLYSDAEPYDVHRVFPCFDQPDVKGSFELSIRAPAGWEVVSNGALAERPDGEGLWRFEPTPSIPSYIVAVIAGPYHVVRERHRNIDLGLLCRRSLAQYLDADEIFEITRAGFDFFDEVFRYPYPFAKYDQIFVPEFNSGAMENAGCVTFNERHVFRSKATDSMREARADTILHEMAHMWFGDLVTMRWWDDLWLNESFATFMSHLALVRATRFTQAWTTFCNVWKTWAYRQDQLPTTHPITADMPDIDSVKVNFDGITYAKGASVLRQLVAWVGEDAFLTGLQRYFRRHEFANTTVDDFLDPLEEESGRDLSAWSKEWLESPGVNTLRVELETERREGIEVVREAAVFQEAAAACPTIRSHRVAVGLYGEDPDGRIRRRRRVELDVVGLRTPIHELEGEPVPGLLLPNDDDLSYAKIRLDGRSLATLATGLARLEDPLARALCWGAAWDMLRDAEIPARRYVALVLANVDGETEVHGLQTLLQQASSAVQAFGDPANRDHALATLAASALDHLHDAGAGSDHQLAWARSFVAWARSEQHLSLARGLLDGANSFDGLAVDTDLRWLIVSSLAAADAIGEAEIAAEVERDPTDAGARHAAAARAARPLSDAKAEAWRMIVEEASLPFATMRALMGAFQQYGQEALLEPYVERYFKALDPMGKTRSPEVVLAFAGALYPHVLVEQEVVDRTEAHLAIPRPGPVRRLLLEGQDGIARALRARVVDAAAAPA
ncbi:MAG: aminopeptidase N [Actinomycetota bacterium]